MMMLFNSWPHATHALLWIMYDIRWIIKRLNWNRKSHLMYGAMWPEREQLPPLKRCELLKVRHILMTVMKMLLEVHNNELTVINYTSLETCRKHNHCLNEKCKRCEFKALFPVFISLKLNDYYSTKSLPTSALRATCASLCSSREDRALFLVYC